MNLGELVRLSGNYWYVIDPSGQLIWIASDDHDDLWEIRIEDEDEERLDSDLRRSPTPPAPRSMNRGSKFWRTRSSTGRSNVKEEPMDIGKPRRTYTVEPIEKPVPAPTPPKVDKPKVPAIPEKASAA
jgi:hypothetical protein